MKDLEYNVKWHFKHKRSNKRAIKALKTVESYKGKLNPKFRKLSDEYATEVLGNKVYAPWLYVFSAFQNNFEDGWIPDNYYSKEVIPKLNGDYGKIADRNFINPFLFSEIETLDLAYYINGKYCTPKSKTTNTSIIKNLLFKEHNKIVYKLENSKRGKGVFILDKNNFDASNIHNNGVFQKFIHQHPFFSEFTDNSVATLRVTTTSDKEGNISVKAAYIRFGRNKDTHVMSRSSVSVPLNINTGDLNSKGYMNWVEVNAHPDSNTLFKNKTIPNFDKCIDKALKMHRVVPFIGCIGWDLAVDNSEEVQLIEWNGINNDIKLSEATTGPCFKNLDWENVWKQK